MGSVPSPAKSNVLVTRIPTCLGEPVFGTVTPLSAGWLLTFAGVSPLATCHAMVPLFMLYAVMRPYGGLMRRKPGTAGVSAVAGTAPTVGIGAPPPLR